MDAPFAPTRTPSPDPPAAAPARAEAAEARDGDEGRSAAPDLSGAPWVRIPTLPWLKRRRLD